MRAPLLLWLGLATFTPAFAADATKPHTHQGVIKAYTGKPAKPALAAEDLAALARGEAVTKQSQGDDGGRGIAVQDIAATPDRVWSKIHSFSKYPEWVENVTACEVYERSGDKIKARFVLTTMMISVEYYVTHINRPAEGYMTWTLDYSRLSDLDDSVGFWIVEPHPEKAGWSRVYYSVDVRIGGWVPSSIEGMIAKSGLTKATAWVKRESEKAG